MPKQKASTTMDIAQDQCIKEILRKHLEIQKDVLNMCSLEILGHPQDKQIGI
jgi:hypothetical protein